MNTKTYRVLWFDDEHATLNMIMNKANAHDILLVGFGNAEEGIEELKSKLADYDAVLLDGIFYRKKGQAGSVSNDHAMGDVIGALKSLEDKKKIPWFVLSGQTKITSGANSFVETFAEGKVFDKLNDTDLEKLWHDIKAAADAQPDTQIRHKFARLFELCTEDYLGTQNTASLMEAIKDADSDHLPDRVRAMERIRDFIERMFAALNKKQLIPDAVWNDQGGLNRSSLFLSGRHPQFGWKDNPIHPTIIFLLKGVLDMSQDVKHDVPDKLSLKVKDFMHQNQSPFLYKALLFQTFEVLLWFHGFMQANPDPEVNQQLWTVNGDNTADAIEGVVEKDEKGNYHCSGILLGYKWVQDNGVTTGCQVRILQTTDNTNERNKHQYPIFAEKAEKL